MRYLNLVMLILLFTFYRCNSKQNKQEKDLSVFIDSLENKVVPLYKGYNMASYEAAVSGNDEDYREAMDYELKIAGILSDTLLFHQLESFITSEKIKDELLKRQVEILYNTMLEYQIDPAKQEKLIKAQNKLEQKFSTFRAELNGAKVSDNIIDSILINSKNSEELKSAWIASKEIGDAVEKDIISLVKLRNEIAHDLGFTNYHEMSLKISDQDPEEIDGLFDEMDTLTSETFVSLKSDIDNYLSKRDHVNKEELMPWHYQDRFFQEGPKIYNVDLDKFYKNHDIIEVVKKYYAGIDLPVDDIIARSDLYEKEGKNQHAFCTNIDREGDVRILANVRGNEYWTNTMLHELGHGVYDKYINSQLPYFLREPAHSFTTEAVANFFGRLATNPKWMMKNIGISKVEADSISNEVKNSLRLQQLVFSRWTQVMYRFEKSMYENPDQDLNKLWWDLVEKYQLLKRPQGRNNADWAAKIHIALYPCYYHNYMLGELLASQLNAYMETTIIGHKGACFTNHPEVGQYLKERVFDPGARYYWNDMIERATGEKLSAKYYAADFVN